ncbi:DUF2950 domain-containing protein [Variovorax robiniae]|uniref:DUF2950 domain-containing protein n=1 Tax=Variovorax robiniae TaxID=1836199 RepID=A0ABU8XC84_9BURK
MLHLKAARYATGVLISMAALASTATFAQRAYPSAEAAADALHDAISRNDVDALRTVLGPDWRRFVPVGSVDRRDVDAFLAAWDKQHKVIPGWSGRKQIAVGDGDWTLPIPIVEKAGAWRFDVRVGADTMRTRRIGRNELAVMQAVLAYYDAQKEYAQRDRDGDGVLEYAQKFASTPGRHDGLYWDDNSAQGQSPLGPLYGGQKPGEGYQGYYFKILKSQGPSAPGGAYDYIIGKRMRSGFALIAWPIQYGETGVTSFMVSHAGVLYQKDLGPQSDVAARAMNQFNPDASWSKVNAP